MADLDGLKEGKDFGIGIPVQSEKFFLKGSHSLDWGMQHRLSQIFNPKSGNTVMLAFDHGYFQGPTTGLERLDLTISSLVPYADVLMATRGALRSSITPANDKAVCLRCSGGQSILKELSNEAIAVEIDDAVRINASAMATQIYIGSEYEHQSIKNLIKLIDTGYKYGIPVLGVTGVGSDMDRTAKYFSLACRIAAELGAHFVKTYFIEEDFEQVTASCPVPIVIAGGKKIPELEALHMARKAIDQGASGVDMGRNIFQSDAPIAMIQAVRAVVHENETAEKAYEMYHTLKNELN